ncbi:tropomyosin-like [Nicotiana sylvestris]|uniref:tropomyosin-like n=1 Tax=Nicotiana sylvestris TaxID=4096 RepID=UPI00388C3584
MYKALSKQKDEALKDLPVLQAELERAQKEASIVKREHAILVKKVRAFKINKERPNATANATTSQVQKKIKLIHQLRAEMNKVKASAEELRRKMDLMASERDSTKEDLASAKDQLQVIKDKANEWSRLNDELRAQLDSSIMEWDSLSWEYTTLKSKLQAASNKLYEVLDMLPQYKNDMEVVVTLVITKVEYMKWLSRRDTFEEIYSRRFDLAAEIEEVKRLRPKRDTCPRARAASWASAKIRWKMP